MEQNIGEELTKLFDLYPMDFTPSAKKIDAEMKEGLVYAFANNGFRKFMENCIRHSNQSLVRSSSREQMLYYQAQMKTLTEIMAAGKSLFVDSELRKNKTEREKALKVEKADKELVNQHGK